MEAIDPPAKAGEAAATPVPNPPAPPKLRRLARLRLGGRLRRRVAWAIALLPVLTVVLSDFWTRGSRLVALPQRLIPAYLVAVLESGLLWATLMIATGARRGPFRWVAAVVFVVFFTAALGGQLYFYSQYSTYLNLDATLFGTSFTGSVFGQLSADGKNFIWNVAPPFMLAVSLAVLSRKFLRPRRRVARGAKVLAPICVVSVFLIPVSYRSFQASTPDVIYFHALGGLAKQLTGVSEQAQIRPGLRSCPVMPTVVAKPAARRNVILLLTESVRYDAHCSDPVPECPIAPEANAAVPDRIALHQLRSNSSTTAIQLAVLWSGLEPTESRERLHGVPLLFDYAHAAGLDSAYWTSHHMMFANSRLWVQDLPTKYKCGATDVDPTADIDVGGDDKLLVERALEQLPMLREPFFAVVHVGNTHVPYKVDPADSPFQPSFSSKDPEDNDAYHNYYKNAVYLQDKAVGRFLRDLKATDYGSRTIVIFTSDHGESFREHGHVGHTGSLHEEEIHVPGWVDAPPGTLTDTERRNLLAHQNAPIFHTDMTPTILDLLGLWGAPELERFKPGVVGQSWIREVEPPKMLALTNCSGVWGCAFRNWGAAWGFKKIHAREWDENWLCYDVEKDPEEKNNLGPEGCGELTQFAERVHHGFPGSSP